MEKELTSDDFAKMQQQAIRRVKEMQQKSKPKDKAEEKPKGENQISSRQSSPQKDIGTEKENIRKNSMLSSLFRLDSDAALILPIMLLLSREGTDDILLLALLYIMT